VLSEIGVGRGRGVGDRLVVMRRNTATKLAVAHSVGSVDGEVRGFAPSPDPPPADLSSPAPGSVTGEGGNKPEP